jgi:hypothetical protein
MNAFAPSSGYAAARRFSIFETLDKSPKICSISRYAFQTSLAFSGGSTVRAFSKSTRRSVHDQEEVRRWVE